MTNTQIKNNIATHVVNKTAAKSISNVELGNDIISIVDYVDEQFPYKKYVALISQTGVSDPVVTTLLENTFSNAIVWTRVSAGLYHGTLTGAFTNLKTWCMICPISPNGVWSLYPIDENQVQLRTWNIASQADTDGFLNETSIQILVYN